MFFSSRYVRIACWRLGWHHCHLFRRWKWLSAVNSMTYKAMKWIWWWKKKSTLGPVNNFIRAYVQHSVSAWLLTTLSTSQRLQSVFFPQLCRDLFTSFFITFNSISFRMPDSLSAKGESHVGVFLVCSYGQTPFGCDVTIISQK